MGLTGMSIKSWKSLLLFEIVYQVSGPWVGSNTMGYTNCEIRSGMRWRRWKSGKRFISKRVQEKCVQLKFDENAIKCRHSYNLFMYLLFFSSPHKILKPFSLLRPCVLFVDSFCVGKRMHLSALAAAQAYATIKTNDFDPHYCQRSKSTF